MKKTSKEGPAGRPSAERVRGSNRPRALEAWVEEEESTEEHSSKRKQSQASAGGASARPSLGGVSSSGGDTSVLINAEEMNDSADWSPEIPFENVRLQFSISFYYSPLFLTGNTSS